MTFSVIRAHIETKVNSAFAGLSPAVPVVFDNTLETPPDLPYVLCLISYTTTTEPLICQNESMTEDLRGNLQITIYANRARGMGQLELYGAEAMKAMNQMYDFKSKVRVKCGSIAGPTPSLSGTDPYALITVSCPFQARVIDDGSGDDDDDGSVSGKLKSSDVLLTNPTP